MMRKHLVASTFLAGVFILIFANVARTESIERHIYGFNDVLSTEDALTFIHTSGGTPKKVLVAAGGFSGSYNAPDGLTTTEFIDTAKSNMVGFFDKALAMNRQRLVWLQSREDKGANPKLDPIIRAKELLSLREQFENTRQAIVSGKPIVYGVVLEGERYQLSALGSHSTVRSHFSLDTLEKAKQSVLRQGDPIRPDHLRNWAGISEKYANMSDAEVNLEISNIVEEE